MATKDPTSATKKKSSKSKAALPFSPDNTTGKTAAFGEDSLTVGNFPLADRELYDMMCVWVKKNGHPPEVLDFPKPKNFHDDSPTMRRFNHKSFSQRYLRHKNSIKTHNWIPPPYDLRLRPFVKCKANNWGEHPPLQKEPNDAGHNKNGTPDEQPQDKEEDISIVSSRSSDSTSSDDEEEVEEEEEIMSSDEDADTESEEEDGDPHCMSDF